MRVMIVDDEQPCIDELLFLFARHPDVFVSGTYINPVKALKAAEASNPDAVFIDVSMPLMNGMVMAEKLQRLGSHIQIIFVTAQSRLLGENGKHRPMLYVLKPISEARLDATLERLRSRLKSLAD